MGAISDTTDSQAATPDDITSPLERDDPETSPVQLTTTDEAKQWARRSLSDYYDNTRTGEAKLAKDAETNANSAKAALRAAQQRLMQDPYAPTPQELAYRQGAALMNPGKSGRPSEGLQSYYGEMAGEAQAERERQAGLASQGLGYQTQMSDIDAKLLSTKQALLAMQEKNSAGLAGKALGVLGRGIGKEGSGPGTKPLSPEGKQAVDEGLVYGSDQWNQRVHDLVQAKVEDAHARSGTDAKPVDPNDLLKVADQFGVPSVIPSPYNNLSTKERQALMRIEEQKALPVFAKNVDTDKQTQNLLTQVDHFLNINKNTHTGPELAGVPLPGVSAGPHGASIHGGEGFSFNPVGYMKSFDPNIKEMDKVTSNILAAMGGQPGFSRVTNYDMQTFQKGVMGIDKPYSVNKNIAIPLKVWGQNNLDWHEFQQNYFQAHHTVQGAETFWNQYLHDNPIFDPQAPVGSYKLNPDRHTWKEYFQAINHGQKLKFRSAPIAESAPSRVGTIDRSSTAPTTSMLPPGQIPGTDPGAPPPRAPNWQPADDQPAMAAGGRVGYDSGGEVDQSYEPGEMNSILNALRAGSTFHINQGRENPHAPATNFGGEALGGAGTVGALLALSRLRGRLGGVGRAASAVGRFAGEHPNYAAIGAGAGAGAVAGGASAPPGDTAQDALIYGLNGAIVAPLARFGGSAASRKLAALSESMRGLPPISAGDRRTVGAIERDIGNAGPGANWQDVQDIMRDDRKLKVPSTLGDAVGPSTTGLAKVGLSRDTPAGRSYTDQLDTRQAGAGERVADKTNQALAPDPYLDQTNKLKSALYSNAAPLYEKAYQMFPAVKSQALNDLMNTPAGQEAASRAFIKMQNKQRPIGQANAVGMVQSPSLEYLDNVKRSLDDMILQEEGTGINYQATDDGRILRGMRDKLRNEVDTATQGPQGQPSPYQLARQQYGGDLEVMDALRSGREDFKGMTPDQLTAKLANMSFAEKDAFRSGVAEGIFRQVGSTAEASNPAKRVLANPDIADKIGTIFDNPRDATRYLAGLQRESETFDASKPILSAAGRGQQEASTPASLATLAKSRLMTEKTANDISQNMSTSALDPQADAKIARLRDAADRLRSRDTLSNKAGVALGAGVAGAYAPSQMVNDQEQQ